MPESVSSRTSRVWATIVSQVPVWEKMQPPRTGSCGCGGRKVSRVAAQALGHGVLLASDRLENGQELCQPGRPASSSVARRVVSQHGGCGCAGSRAGPRT